MGRVGFLPTSVLVRQEGGGFEAVGSRGGNGSQGGLPEQGRITSVSSRLATSRFNNDTLPTLLVVIGAGRAGPQAAETPSVGRLDDSLLKPKKGRI